ncbi:hypothetical protein [Sphaerisporangium sp. TRM90804]|uniref:hypothetical protein n=1 Tax=Sphaerisporangium sp. TRM90804 TaxID=3031113 RepID=UPI002448AD49|nr:hypothetical protein [Sphaerisporangium sp. TRM90804]MDH2428907.1 hypothetical protein [Sphaerisporangium sp. TRM90804]
MNDLERRYRRLLAWYPRDHRDAHEDEMIGVLLASARPGLSRPDPREVIPLITGALRLHARRAFGRGAAGPWRDAFAVAGVIGLVLVSLNVLGSVTSIGVRVGQGLPIEDLPLSGVVLCLLLLIASVGALAAVALNLRWTSAVAGWAVVAAAATRWATMEVPTSSGGGGMWIAPLSRPELWLSLALVAAVALTLTRAPRRGLTLPGTRRAAVWASGMLLPLVLPRYWVFFESQLTDLALDVTFTAVAFAATGLALRSPLGRRCVALLALPLALNFVSNIEVNIQAGWLFASLSALIPLGILARLARRRPSDLHPHPGGQRV